jgi:hypothetical protein
MSMFQRGPWLGQVPLVTNLSMGATAIVPPYYGQWSVTGGANGQVGPFDTPEDAFQAAVKAARDAGAARLPDNGYARVVDSQGNPAGPAT